MSAERGDLPDAVMRGESGAFARLAEPYRAELERFAVRMAGGDASLAEEVMQEALLNAYRSIRAGARPENVRPWLYAIVRNCALNMLRGRRTAVPLSEESHGGCQEAATHELERREWMDWLMGAIGALPPRQRDALVAYAFEGRSHREIAGTMGTSVSAVKTLLHRARRTLEAAQPSSPAAVPGAAMTLVRRAGVHARRVVAAKLGAKGAAAVGWQALVAATVATSVALLAHSGAGPLPASAQTPNGGVATARAASQGRHGPSDDRRNQSATRAAAVRREGRRALRECLNGRRLSRGLSRGALRYATGHLSEDAREYTECEQVFRHAQLARLRGRRAPRRRRARRGRA